MIRTTMIRQLRICEIIIICLLAKSVYGKTLNKAQDHINKQKVERVKRGYSHFGGNDFGSPTHVSSGALQYSGGDDSRSLDASLDIPLLSEGYAIEHIGGNEDPWAATGISSGYDIWLQPVPDYHGNSAVDLSTTHTSSVASKHPGSDHIVNTVFSDDSVHAAHLELPRSQLHTQISSSSIANSAAHTVNGIHDHGTLAINDNLDFKNDDGLTRKHYFKSYGK